MTKKRSGFTLIELMIVIVIIGIIAGIALPKLAKTREKAYFKSVVYDLRNLATQQELYFTLPQNLYSYAATTVDLPDFQPSKGVTVAIGETTTFGWVATGSHGALLAAQQCGVFVGTVSAKPAWLTKAGVVTCTGD
ncbi:MAG TPA: prepilin-type N-terminal cleavage/methylation domain-containing protein [Longimicrobiales bacterium]|nr:prepilin-type N-terminal cleavage/methylation domain-containing protein [Longimicrobiales bacterium]